MDIRKECRAFRFDLDAFLRKSPHSISTSTAISNVYLLTCGEYVKVGMARDVRRRIDDLQIANPYPLEYVHSYEFEGPRYARLCEMATHEMLSPWSHRGEWFATNITRARRALDAAFAATEKLKAKHDAFKRTPVNDNVAAHVFPYSPMARAA